MRKKASIPEDDVQEHVVKLLRAYGRHDIVYFAVPNGGWRKKREAAKLVRMGVRKGASDLILGIDSHTHALELKTEVGTLSEDQLEFKEDAERAGWIFHVAFGLDQAIGVLQGISAFRPGISFSTPAPSGHRVRTGEAANKAVSPDKSGVAA